LTENIDQEQKRSHGEPDVPAGRLLALDLGRKRVGLAVSDEMQITVRPLPALRRTNWKQLLRGVADSLASFDARALVIGLPLRLDGSAGDAAEEARHIARKFQLSLPVPVFLQDEKLTSFEALEGLRAAGYDAAQSLERVDSESAVIILRDFIAGRVSTSTGAESSGGI
jgi:putative Holliday junction resolvase